MENLKTIYTRYMALDGDGDKGTAHSYIDVYDEVLTPYRISGNVLEIGISLGYSIKMWREYFINGMVAGVDVTIRPEANDLLNNDKYKIFHCDATKREFITQLNGLTFDVIIDDGSHYLHEQMQTFNLLKNSVNVGGIYIIEDIKDIDYSRRYFQDSLHDNCEIIDLRYIKNRKDDVLAIYKF
jgi:hypothetical protein